MTSKHITDPAQLAALAGRPLVPYFTADETVNSELTGAQCVRAPNSDAGVLSTTLD